MIWKHLKNKKSKTFYDIVPTTLAPVVLLRFRTRREAQEYLDKNKLSDTWVIITTRIEL